MKQHELKNNLFFTSDYLKFIITNLLNTFFIADITEKFTKQLLKPFNNISYSIYASNKNM